MKCLKSILGIGGAFGNLEFTGHSAAQAPGIRMATYCSGAAGIAYDPLLAGLQGDSRCGALLKKLELAA
jgi:hypothetical protein